MPRDDEPASGGNLAPRRVRLASDRTVLASERTYSAWVRTGFAALVSGLAVMRFMADVLPFWGLKFIALTLIAYSAFCFVTAIWRQWHLQKRFPKARIPHLSFALIAAANAALTAASLLALVALWLLRKG